MYQVDEKDKVIELKDVPQSSVGAPLPIVLSSEYKTLLAYLLEDMTENWDGTTIRIVDFETRDEQIAIIEFNSCGDLMFGSPNDEAFEGHPLESRGLHPYGVFEIENSSWLRQLERMNSVHERHNPENYAKYKHFVFAFHDSTFECIAISFEISIHEGSLESILPEMQKRLFNRYD
jgi:hypothetical protein